jgi:hypothetical protein
VEALEERLKSGASTEPKAGMLRALEVASTASAITKRAAAPHQARCQLELPRDRAYTYSFSLDVQRKSGIGVESRWTEERTLRRDADGDLAAIMHASFRTELGGEGRRSPQWMLVDQDSYVSVDGRSFYRREASPGERRRLAHSASATMQTLLDGVSIGWSRVEPDSEGPAVFTVGGERLVCGPSATRDDDLSFDAGWLRRFETRATPLGGELSVPRAGSRKLEVRWQLEDASTLEVRFEDRLVDGAEPIEAPDESSLVVVERDRSLRRIERLFEEMVERGLVDTELESGVDQEAIENSESQ